MALGDIYKHLVGHGQELRNWTLERLTADPGSPAGGRLWERTDNAYAPIARQAESGRIVRSPDVLVEQISGRFYIDNQADDLSGMGITGAGYNFTTDLGSFTTTNLSRTAGGYMYPFDVRVLETRMVFYQSNATMGVTDWGFIVSSVNKTLPGNTRATTFIYDERTAGVDGAVDADWVGPGSANGARQYNSTENQSLQFDLVQANGGTPFVLPAGDALNFAVFQRGTADANNRYVYIQSGYLVLEIA